jgi:hypothetical protein
MVSRRQGAVMAQLRRIFYCCINLAIALIARRCRNIAIKIGPAIGAHSE